MKTAKRTRVLMLLENCTYPQDNRVRHEALALTRAGYSVTVICPRKNCQKWFTDLSPPEFVCYGLPKYNNYEGEFQSNNELKSLKDKCNTSENKLNKNGNPLKFSRPP